MADPKRGSAAVLAAHGDEAQPAAEPIEAPTGRRRVRLRTSPEGQVIEVRDPKGDLEVEVRVTDAGAVVHLKNARLELEATESVDVRCQTFSVHAEQSVQFISGGSLRMEVAGDHDIEAQGDYRVKADTIWLN